MESYLNILNNILGNGFKKEDRTGTGTIAIAGTFFEHDMSKGFPILTTKRVPFNLVASELEFFIRGLTDKRWLQERNNHIWDEWCSPDKVPYGHDNDTKNKMLKEFDLGPVYGRQWRNFSGSGIDQLKNLVNTLKTNPSDRRMIVSAWSPSDIPHMALPPCHWAFQCTVLDGRLNLMWNQRSVDVFLGLPFNIASYALLLHLLAKECKLDEGKLCGFLGDTHIYTNHLTQVEKQLSRVPYELPSIKTEVFTSIFDWVYTDTKVINYKHYPGISAPIAV